MIQTAPPRLPFVRRVGRFVIDVLDAGFLQVLVDGAAASNNDFFMRMIFERDNVLIIRMNP